MFWKLFQEKSLVVFLEKVLAWDRNERDAGGTSRKSREFSDNATLLGKEDTPMLRKILLIKKQMYLGKFI